MCSYYRKLCLHSALPFYVIQLGYHSTISIIVQVRQNLSFCNLSNCCLAPRFIRLNQLPSTGEIDKLVHWVCCNFLVLLFPCRIRVGLFMTTLVSHIPLCQKPQSSQGKAVIYNKHRQWKRIAHLAVSSFKTLWGHNVIPIRKIWFDIVLSHLRGIS